MKILFFPQTTELDKEWQSRLMELAVALSSQRMQQQTASRALRTRSDTQPWDPTCHNSPCREKKDCQGRWEFSVQSKHNSGWELFTRTPENWQGNYWTSPKAEGIGSIKQSYTSLQNRGSCLGCLCLQGTRHQRQHAGGTGRGGRYRMQESSHFSLRSLCDY